MPEISDEAKNEISNNLDDIRNRLNLNQSGNGGVSSPINYKTGFTLASNFDVARNRIVFGAPGTGKSHKIEEDVKTLLHSGGEYERVTFHPEYTYSQFFGTYKPVMDGKDISYNFVPGPFLRIWVKAINNGRTRDIKPYVLIIEEINRARVAAVFGDIFQLLDRDKSGVSKYDVNLSEDVKRFLADPNVLGGIPDDYSSIRIPDNMFLWSTMNSADQGVYTLDTAFKRRWNYEYIGIDNDDGKITGQVELIKGDPQSKVSWNQLRKAINEKLSKELKVNEDKLIGPFYLSGDIIEVTPGTTDIADQKKFRDAFKSKILMYLFDDVAKQGAGRSILFEGCDDTTRYSRIISEFDKKGMGIFGNNFKSDYYDAVK